MFWKFRFDIERQVWTSRNNPSMESRTGYMAVIEFNGSIHIAFTEHGQSPISFARNRPSAALLDHLPGVHIDRRNARSPTRLYCFNPANGNNTWQLKADVANRAIFAKTSTSLYVIEDNRVLHRYDPNEGALTMVSRLIILSSNKS